MNKPITESDLVTPKVTTGALPASRKVYSQPDAASDLRVPSRLIELDASSSESPLPVYDTTGPYTDPAFAADVEKGLPRTRIEWVKERGGVEEYEGRPIKPVDNGNVSGKHLARNFPNTPKPWRAISSFRGAADGREPGIQSQAQSQHLDSGSGAARRPGMTAETHHPLTQLEWARAGIITKEMIYVAERENL